MLRSAITLTLVLGSLTVSAFAGASDVYKYTDEKGNVLYTDKPRTLPAERLNVVTSKADPAAAQARQSAEMKRMQDADAARKAAATQQASQSGATQLNAQDRAERCSKARTRYDTYMNSQKLYEEKDGERHYLTSEELDAARASAKANMDSWCK